MWQCYCSLRALQPLRAAQESCIRTIPRTASRDFCELCLQKTPRGTLPVEHNAIVAGHFFLRKTSYGMYLLFWTVTHYVLLFSVIIATWFYTYVIWIYPITVLNFQPDILPFRRFHHLMWKSVTLQLQTSASKDHPSTIRYFPSGRAYTSLASSNSS